jgi:acyl carrier protein
VNHSGERILTFVRDKFPLARKKAITAEDDLLESGIIDSLGVLDLVSFLEHEFGIIVADDELVPDHFQNVLRLTRFVERKVNEAAASR